MRPLPHPATVSATSSPFLMPPAANPPPSSFPHPCWPRPDGGPLPPPPPAKTLLGACSPAPSGLGALSSRQQQHLTSWGKLWGKNDVQELTVEGLRRETKGLWGSDEGGIRHDSLLDPGRGGSGVARQPPAAACCAGDFTFPQKAPPALCHLYLVVARDRITPAAGSLGHPCEHRGPDQSSMPEFQGGLRLLCEQIWGFSSAATADSRRGWG